mmetsp:Transcript_25651/g.81452  ORF Transcript_25651/g.81452 Transcript_25651/m.81452 type:complete len:443 (-) Transcript_25651:478-1806(-)
MIRVTPTSSMSSSTMAHDRLIASTKSGVSPCILWSSIPATISLVTMSKYASHARERSGLNSSPSAPLRVWRSASPTTGKCAGITVYLAWRAPSPWRVSESFSMSSPRSATLSPTAAITWSPCALTLSLSSRFSSSRKEKRSRARGAISKILTNSATPASWALGSTSAHVRLISAMPRSVKTPPSSTSRFAFSLSIRAASSAAAASASTLAASAAAALSTSMRAASPASSAAGSSVMPSRSASLITSVTVSLPASSTAGLGFLASSAVIFRSSLRSALPDTSTLTACSPSHACLTPSVQCTRRALLRVHSSASLTAGRCASKSPFLACRVASDWSVCANPSMSTPSIPTIVSRADITSPACVARSGTSASLRSSLYGNSASTSGDSSKSLTSIATPISWLCCATSPQVRLISPMPNSESIPLSSTVGGGSSAMPLRRPSQHAP